MREPVQSAIAPIEDQRGAGGLAGADAVVFEEHRESVVAIGDALEVLFKPGGSKQGRYSAAAAAAPPWRVSIRASSFWSRLETSRSSRTISLRTSETSALS